MLLGPRVRRGFCAGAGRGSFLSQTSNLLIVW